MTTWFTVAVLAAACSRPPAEVAHAPPRARFAIDEAHRNYHTYDGRYAPFASVLRAEGFAVRASAQRLDEAALRDVDVLVIANATADDGRSAIDDGEIAAVKGWVERGGALWLIADHHPFGGAAAPLARAFGVEMSNGLVGDEQHHWPGADDAGNIVFTAATGLAADHPIARSVQTVVTFVGQSLHGPPDSIAILRLSDDAREMLPPDRHVVSAAGRAQALALSVGHGRVFVAGEAAMFTEQTKPNGTPMGMNAPGNDDRQFTINIARWLARRL